MSSRASAIAPAGIVLSQPTEDDQRIEQVAARDELDESVMTSRLTNEARMPGEPMVIRQRSTRC
jgi:hypothetical protein